MRQFLRDLRWMLPLSLLLGLGLSLLSPGTWWTGWLTYALLLFLGSAALAALWRSAGASRTLGGMLLLAVALRLGLGMAFSFILPVYGNDTPVQKAGYIFADAYRRDTQAWTLANSPDSLLKAFDKTTATSDQYGGLLFLSSLVYRLGSPEVHRSWLIILLAALVSGIGVALAYKAARTAWGERVALLVGWIMALFPEAVLLGSSQMREPFLMTFITMGLWGLVQWPEARRSSLAWLAGSLVGLLLFNPGVGVAAILVLAVWSWLGRQERRISWWVWTGGIGVVVLAALLFSLALNGSGAGAGGPLARVLDWIRLSATYDASLLERNSGWLQSVFKILPPILHMPFIVAYGILQPVLPAAMADPAVWPMRVLGVLRGLGWYALLPLLIYSLRSVLNIADRRERQAWLWLWIAAWVWILLSSFRAGGDQWDNPRYRAILLIFQAALAAQALTWRRVVQDRWLGRILAMEGVALLIFGYWYFARYGHWSGGQVHVLLVIILIGVFSGGILLAGWWMDRARAAHGKRFE